MYFFKSLGLSHINSNDLFQVFIKQLKQLFNAVINELLSLMFKKIENK